jgi:hypothetical protein
VVAVVVIRWFWSFVVWTVTVAPYARRAAYTWEICSAIADGVGSYIPKIMSLI